MGPRPNQAQLRLPTESRHLQGFGSAHCGDGVLLRQKSFARGAVGANGIPAGLCYQRLSIDGKGPPYCLHGLNAVWLPEIGWYRLDARGNRTDVSAEFDPPHERLAFPIQLDGEYNLPDVFAEPLPQVVTALKNHTTWDAVLANLPDVESG